MQTLIRVPKFCFALGMLALVAVVGCGTGGSPILNHTTGSFTNANLKGSYVYQIHGVSVLSGNVYREVGVFTADGSGNITGGTDDSSVSAGGTAVTGSYTVSSDGTGFITMNTSLGQITLALTLVSSSKIELIENDAALDAAGTAELQESTATPSGTFVFRLHQEASAQSPSAEEASQVGAFTLSSGAGNGAMDQNLNGTFTSPNLTVTFNAPVSSGRGTGNLVDTLANFTTGLVYYVVNSGKLALLVSNAGAVGSGSAEAQTGVSSTTSLSGSYVFGSRGDDTFLDGVAAVGQFTATAGSLSGTEDVAVDGNFSANVSFPSSCYTTGSAGGVSGRVVLTGSGAPCSGSTTQVFWMVSPSRAFFLDNSGSIIEDGTADLQTVSSFSASNLKGQFVIVMDGLDRTPEQFGSPDQILSRVGTLQFDGINNLTLNELVNASGSGSGGQSPGILAGTYSVSSSGRVVGNLNNHSLDLVMYAVSGSQVYVLQSDAGVVTSGTVEMQQ